MAFNKMTKQEYPPRLWALIGYPESGKTTFSTQMRGPLLIVDADQRFAEVLDLATDRDVYELSNVACDNTDPDRIAGILAREMPGSEIGTIVVDSLTSIIAPLVTQAMVDKDAGRTKNLAQGWRTKALAMRQLQDGITRWGTDTLWIYHLQDARGARAEQITKPTVSQTELARLMRSLNLQLRIVQERDRRGIKVTWARRGRSGMTLWDDSGAWIGMPEKIEDAVYAGLSRSEQVHIAQQIPAIFPNAETAIAWGFERGAFKDLLHARNAYNKLKREEQPQTAREMATLWTASVQTRSLNNHNNA